MSKYPLLNDKKWLYEKYIREGFGTIKICKLSGAKTPNSVRQALIKYNIPVRTIGDGLRINRKDDGLIINKEVIDGCLLGDGFLCKWNKNSDVSFPYFAKRNKYYDHIKYVSNLLLHWFLDDGNSYQARKNSRTKQIIITLCSECFSKNNQEMIMDKVNNKFNLSMRLNKANSGVGYRIVVPQSKASLFYDIIGPCPVPSMEYKWK